MRALSAVLLLAVLSCGAPVAAPAAPGGTLVIVVRQGPERVPFEPKLDRIRRANEQLAAILGHSIQIELDGALLPQDRAGAEDVMARLVETVAQDLDAMKRWDARVLPFAGATFERLVVRYSPTEAAKRGRHRAELDRATRTIDVALAEARWVALERGEVASPILRSFDGDQASRYARVLPDQLPAGEQKAWLEYHLHGHGKPDPTQVVGSFDALRVRGAIMLAKDGDPDARRYLVERATDELATTYRHHRTEMEATPPGGPFRQAEAAFVAFLKATLPSMTPEERGHLARHLWVYDSARSHERDPYAAFAFPGLDKMAFGFAEADAWVAAGHPSRVRVFDDVLDPVRIDTAHGELGYHGEGRHDPDFYRWALAAPEREDAFSTALLQRKDPALVASAFYNAHTALREEADYLRFLRRFEQAPAHWRAGADVHRSIVFRPSPALLEEARRQWRELPHARGHALFYFARQADGSYHPEVEWPDMLQGVAFDDVVLSQVLALGWPGYELLPTFWRELARSPSRLGLVTTSALALLREDVHVPPGHRNVGGVLAALGRIACEDDDRAEVAALRRWAEEQIPSHPGQGLSQILEQTEPSECKPKRRPPPPRKPAAPRKPKWKEGDPLPPKDGAF